MYYDTKFDPYRDDAEFENEVPELFGEEFEDYDPDLDYDYDYDFEYDNDFDYELFEGDFPRAIRRRRGARRIVKRVVALVLVLAVIVSGIYVGVKYDLSFDSRGAGASISLVPKDKDSGIAGSGYTEPAQTVSPVSQVQQAPLGDGTTLTVAPLPGGEQLSNQELFRRCSPSIVSVVVLREDGAASGTGIIMSADGYIITNNHVIEECLSITVTAGDTEYIAALVGQDVQTDLAVLKIDAEGLSPAEFGDSGRAVVGDDVVAIGNPLGQNLTMTKGIISGIDRSVNSNGYMMTLLQTSAQINSGNSGGALINMFGQVIGITNLKLASSDGSVEGIGFAIPTAIAKQVVDSIIEHGYVSGRPALGVTVRGVSTVASAYYGTPGGLLVVSVSRNSDAYNQGLREGDIITQVMGQPVETTAQLRELISVMHVGEVLPLTIYRDGESFELGVALVESAFVNASITEE